MADELKLCPLCCGEPTGPWEVGSYGDTCRIYCQGCGLTIFDTQLDRAVWKWNRRDGEAAFIAELAEAKRLLARWDETAANVRVTKERDEARAECERLRNEREAAIRRVGDAYS